MIKQIKKANTPDELEEITGLKLEYEIGQRGGYLDFYGSALAVMLGFDESKIANKFGSHVNYLGGGLRGSVVTSAGQYSEELPESTKNVLEALAEASKRAYESIENESDLNDVEYSDGDTNWEAVGTGAMRNAGVETAIYVAI